MTTPSPYGSHEPHGSPPAESLRTPGPVAGHHTETNQLATVAFILSLVGLGTGLTAPAGAICGHVALGQIRRDPAQRGRGMALAAIIVGWVITALLLAYIGLTVAVLTGHVTL